MANPLTAWQMLGLGSAFAGLGLGSNMISSSINSHKAWKYAQKAMALQYQYQKKGLLESPGLSRKGLESAGYNPLLALGSSNTIGNVSSNGVPDMTSSMPDLAESAVGALNGYKEGKLLDTNINSAQTDLDIKKEQLEKLQRDNKTSPANLLTNPKARKEFVEGLPKPLKNSVNSALSVANTENKIGKVAEVIKDSVPNHPRLAERIMSNVISAYTSTPYGTAKSLYNFGKSYYKNLKRIYNNHSARSGVVTGGNRSYKVDFLPDNLGNSDLLRR